MTSRKGATQHFLMALTALVVGLSVQTAQAQSTWIVTGNVAEAGGTNADVSFGVNPNGSDNLDDGNNGTTDLSEGEAPPAPPAGAFDTRWTDAGGFGLNGFFPQKVVAGTNATQHTMQLNFTRAAGGNITVTWDMAALALATSSATITDLAGGFFGVPTQDMRTTSSVLVTNAAATGLAIVFTSNTDYTQPVPPEAEVLVFSTQPGTVTSGIASTVVVNAKDTATSTNQAGASIVLTLASGAGALGGTLTATTDASGDATFSNVIYTAAVDGESFTLNAATSSNTPGTLVNLVSAAGTGDVVATALAFTTQPASSTSGSALGTQPVVTARDAAGTTDTGFTGTVALTEGAAGALSGTASLAAVAGVATFTNVAYTATADGESFTLTAASAGVTSATSGSVTSDVVATQLVFTTQPASAFNATPMLTQPVVTAQDASNLTDTGFTGTVTLALTDVAVTTGPTVLSGTVAVAAVAGVVTYATVQADVVTDGDTFNLTAASGGVTSATSSTIAGSILPAPTLTPVGAAGENHAPLLSWGAVVVAASYELDFGVSPACTSILNAFSTTATSYQSGQLADGTYCWNVRSVGATSNLSPNATDTFVTIPTFGEWGMIFLIASMAGCGAWYLRQRKATLN
jgi:hypothetical protein